MTSNYGFHEFPHNDETIGASSDVSVSVSLRGKFSRQKERFGAFYLAGSPVQSPRALFGEGTQSNPSENNPEHPAGWFFARVSCERIYSCVRRRAGAGAYCCEIIGIVMRGSIYFVYSAEKCFHLARRLSTASRGCRHVENVRGRTEMDEGRPAKRRGRRASVFRSRQKLLIRQCVHRAGRTIVELSE